MQVGVLGINYKTSDLVAREKVTRLIHTQVHLEKISTICTSYILLSTCNRLEIYFSGDDLPSIYKSLVEMISQHVDFCVEPLLYHLFDNSCFLHLCRVASGIDSVIFGESEIQRQVKQAYVSASYKRPLSSSLHYIFQKALHVGKGVRTEFSLPRKQSSIEEVIHQLLLAFCKEKESPSILMVGNSEINRKVLTYLKGKKYTKLMLATRSPQPAQLFCQKYGVELLPWMCLHEWVGFDAVICGTNQPSYLLKGEDTLRFIEPVRLIPTTLLVDLSMPRNIDPILARHPQMTLFNIEEINAILKKQVMILTREKETIIHRMQEKAQRSAASYNMKNRQRALCIS